MGAFEIKPLTPATWEAFAALAKKHNGVWGGCWCTWFHPAFPEKRQGKEANRDLKHRLVEEGKAHAALVFDGDVAVGWCEYGTPEELPNIYHRAEYERERDTQGKRISASFLYNGTRTLFEKAGFERVRSKGKYNCVMRTTVEPA